MNYLLDTNVISEFASPTPNAGVINWLHEHQQADNFLSVITIGEIQQGIERLPDSKKRTQLENWLHKNLLVVYKDYILPLDSATLLAWGSLTGKLIKRGQKTAVMDGLIAATALEHNLTLVTRNIADFAATGVPLLNPWEL